MQILLDAGLILLGYLLGSIPFGLIWVKLISGKDIRHVASGRTGGTNAARAAGAGAGILTAIMDVAKGACAAWIAMGLSPDHHWVHVLAPLAAILGHNYSLFLIERDSTNRVRLRGGAGGGPTVGGAIGLWWPSVLIVIPIALLVFFGIGYASVTTMSIAVTITAIFAVGYFLHLPGRRCRTWSMVWQRSSCCSGRCGRISEPWSRAASAFTAGVRGTDHGRSFLPKLNRAASPSNSRELQPSRSQRRRCGQASPSRRAADYGSIRRTWRPMGRHVLRWCLRAFQRAGYFSSRAR